MKKSMTWKIVLIILVIGFSIFLSYPPKEKIRLGLDLKGGIHLVLQVITDDAIKIQTDQNIAQLKSLLNESSIKFEKISRKDINKFELSGIAYEDEGNIKDILDDYFRDWNYTFSTSRVTLTIRPNIEMQMRDQSVNQALETIRNRIDEYGVSEPVIQKELLSEDRLLIQLPGIDDPGRVKDLIKSTAMLTYHEVVSGPFPSQEAALKEYNNALPEDFIILKEKLSRSERKTEKGFYVLNNRVIVSGNDIKNARRGTDDYGGPAVSFSLNSKGTKQMEKYSAANIGKKMAIVLDERVIVVATIQTTLSYDNRITGGFTAEYVDDLVLKLRSGALPAPLKPLFERTIGPSLGADSIRKGIIAAVTGLILVMLFMLFYYKAAGINSIVALTLNIVILMGVLAYFRATLTLPGIAGIILTIGMAVDANVLIFERIKEDLRLGKSPKSALDSGFKKAFVTIFDANLTTIIAAIFLFQFGTGPIKGFSVTLIIGIAASMFTAVFVSRVIFDLVYAKKKKLQKISI
jgi:preprotein translocase subunit SecD